MGEHSGDVGDAEAELGSVALSSRVVGYGADAPQRQVEAEIIRDDPPTVPNEPSVTSVALRTAAEPEARIRGADRIAVGQVDHHPIVPREVRIAPVALAIVHMEGDL